MTNDPLVLEAVRIIKEQQKELFEVFAVAVFKDMYEVGKTQGRMQGLRAALQSIDDASKKIYEES